VEILRYAAIDVGSNALRILFSNVLVRKDQPAEIIKSHMVRAPVRLGEDVFSKGKVSNKKLDLLVHSFKAFHHLMKVYNVEKYKAYATSAMREASNADEVIEKIEKESGIELKVIDGKKEAEIIFSTQLSNLLDIDENYLYMDVGGGSVELTLFSKGEVHASKSFALGTIRLLQNKDLEKEKNKLKDWVNKYCEDIHNISLVGSGGNINKIFKLTGGKNTQALPLESLVSIHDELSKLSYDDRISQFKLNPDRADVIIPAASLFINVMQQVNAKQIFVPKVGLADGMIMRMVSK
jgi:exopolyphosphatase/guanosine-5'-triphosphate,3'-diphosphate pyrophosphatase